MSTLICNEPKTITEGLREEMNGDLDIFDDPYVDSATFPTNSTQYVRRSLVRSSL